MLTFWSDGDLGVWLVRARLQELSRPGGAGIDIDGRAVAKGQGDEAIQLAENREFLLDDLVCPGDMRLVVCSQIAVRLRTEVQSGREGLSRDNSCHDVRYDREEGHGLEGVIDDMLVAERSCWQNEKDDLSMLLMRRLCEV